MRGARGRALSFMEICRLLSSFLSLSLSCILVNRIVICCSRFLSSNFHGYARISLQPFQRLNSRKIYGSSFSVWLFRLDPAQFLKCLWFRWLGIGEFASWGDQNDACRSRDSRPGASAFFLVLSLGAFRSRADLSGGCGLWLSFIFCNVWIWRILYWWIAAICEFWTASFSNCDVVFLFFDASLVPRSCRTNYSWFFLLKFQVSFFIGFVSVLAAWIYAEFLEYKKNVFPSKTWVSLTRWFLVPLMWCCSLLISKERLCSCNWTKQNYNKSLNSGLAYDGQYQLYKTKVSQHACIKFIIKE